ncbi:YciI family protein [Allorhizocola rhizosphaerae]|uniref:YciI family protein n=1 Tax=Allorhizocola rhizosphaerae TaxID=1872709 RepID=UPI000E3C090D|nr:YciI family protein [Allorhizocola rhizosphaerae]
MKYILLAYTKQSDWDNVDVTSPEFIAACQFYEDLGKELIESGEAVSTEGLGHPSLSRTVRPAEGGPVVVDGPFAEAKEVLVSFGIVDVATHDRAVEIAKRIVANVGDTVEVRPIMDGGGGLPDDTAGL